MQYTVILSSVLVWIYLLLCMCAQTLQMGIQHFSGLFVLLCVGVAGALLTLLGEHTFFRFILPYLRHQQRFKYWLHTSQVSACHHITHKKKLNTLQK